jgi:hypothetical protein
VQHAVRWYLGFLWLAAASAVSAQTCDLPVPFQYEFQHNVTASLSAANASDPCALSVALNNGAGPTASGFLHYRRGTPTTFIRYGFRVDTSALTNFSLPNRLVQLFAASSPAVSTSPGPVSNVLQILIVGGSSPTLRFYAASASSVSGLLLRQVSLTQTVNTVRFEINVGSGTAGFVRYWINHQFTDPPDGVIDHNGAGLDNAAWIGVIGAELGMSSPSNGFRIDYGGSIILFDQIESSDDVLFYDDFSSGAQ